MTRETLCTNDLNLVMRHLWSPKPAQLILQTTFKLLVLYLLCQQAACLRVLALQFVDVLLNVFADDVMFGCQELIVLGPEEDLEGI